MRPSLNRNDDTVKVLRPKTLRHILSLHEYMRSRISKYGKLNRNLDKQPNERIFAEKMVIIVFKTSIAQTSLQGGGKYLEFVNSCLKHRQ